MGLGGLAREERQRGVGAGLGEGRRGLLAGGTGVGRSRELAGGSGCLAGESQGEPGRISWPAGAWGGRGGAPLSRSLAPKPDIHGWGGGGARAWPALAGAAEPRPLPEPRRANCAHLVPLRELLARAQAASRLR